MLGIVPAIVTSAVSINSIQIIPCCCMRRLETESPAHLFENETRQNADYF